MGVGRNTTNATSSPICNRLLESQFHPCDKNANDVGSAVVFAEYSGLFHRFNLLVTNYSKCGRKQVRITKIP